MYLCCLVIFSTVARVYSANQCTINYDDVECTQVQKNPTNITGLIKELSLSKSKNWGFITINNKNFPRLYKYLFENFSIDHLTLRQNNIEWIEDGAFDRIKLLKELDLSYNQLTQFKSSAALTYLRILDLSFNNIRMLDVNSFNKLKVITEIKLKYNSIENLAPGIFNLPSLTKLTLVGNNLKECVNSTFNNLAKLTYLSLKSNNIQTIQPGCFNGLGLLTALYIDQNLLEDSNISIFSPLRSVSSLYVFSNVMTKVSANLLKGLNKVEDLSFRDNFIESIDEGAWRDLKSMTSLHLELNLIRTLTPQMFKYAVSLQNLYISYNLIQTIERNAFAGLENCLTRVEINNNRLEYLKSFYFLGLKKLKTLKISDNMISFIEVSTFRDLTSLVTLDLGHNALFTIQPSVLSNMQSLTTLILRQNCLKSMRIYSKLPSLTSLDLSSNRITQIDFDYLKENSPEIANLVISENIFDNRSLYLSAINGTQSLDVSQTNLESISIDRAISSLTSLNISCNPFLRSVVGLEYVQLEQFYLRQVNQDLLKSIDINKLASGLVELDLSFNNLENISSLRLSKIKKLFLSNTFQTTRQLSDVFTKSDTITEIDLSGNKLKRVSISEISDNIEILNLANNEIAELDTLGSGESLDILDLSYNKIKAIKKKWFEGLPGLSELYLSNNMIESIEPDSFSMGDFTTLHIQNNRLKFFSYVYFNQGLTNPLRLENLLISNNNLTMLDLTGFTLELMSLSYNSLANQAINNFVYSSSDIESLTISFNNLTHIEQIFFSKAVRIQSLNLSHNQIAYIEPSSFDSMTLLEQLDLSYNRIIELNVGLFDRLSGLTHLEMSHNQLKYIKTECFKYLRSLLYLGLNSNEIKLIEDLSFNEDKLLIELSLDSNSENLTFTNETFTGLESISFITVSPEYLNSHENLVSVKESLLSNSGRFVGSRSYSPQVEIEYYRAISLNYLVLPSWYEYCECYNIMTLARKGIQLNVNSEKGVQLFVDQCSSYFNNLFEDVKAT